MQVYAVLEPGRQANRRPAGGRAWAARRGGSRATADDRGESVQDSDVPAVEAMSQNSESRCADGSQRAGIRDRRVSRARGAIRFGQVGHAGRGAAGQREGSSASYPGLGSKGGQG
jgi:hypothetical protein